MSDDSVTSIALDTPSGPLELAYRDVGQGKPLLLLHGFFGEGGDWAHLPGLGADMRAIIPDLRGHGRSSNPSARFTFRDAADDVLRLLDRLAIEGCCAVGLSGGALTLLRMAVARPRAIDSMVLVSACDGFPREARLFMAAFAADKGQQVAGELRARHVRGAQQVEALFACARDFADGRDDADVSADELASIEARTLIVSGDRDPLYAPEVALRLYRSIRGAALWVVPNEGHTPVFGHARAEFISRTRSFFA